MSAARFLHLPTGIVVVVTMKSSRAENLKDAPERLLERLGERMRRESSGRVPWGRESAE
jgi:protein subunit release factor A